MKYQSVIYKNMLVLMNVLENLKYTDKNGAIQPVRVITASREKALDDFMYNKNRTDNRSISNILPAVTCMVESTTYNAEFRQQNIAQMQLGDGIMYTAVPYTLTYRCNIFGYSYHTVFEILEQLQLIFSPHFTVSVRYFPSHPPINEPFTFTAGGITVDIDYDVNGDRIVGFDFSISTNYWIYQDTKLIPQYNVVFEFDVENGSPIIITKTVTP